MPLLDDIKASLRVSGEAFDAEVRMLVDAALYDLRRVGVDPALLEPDEGGDIANAYVKTAVTVYVKSRFGYDNPEAARFDEAYRRIVCDLLISPANIAEIDRKRRDAEAQEGPQEGEPENEPIGEPEDDAESEPEPDAEGGEG